MSDPSITKLPSELEQFGVDEDLRGKLRTKKGKKRAARLSVEEFIYIGNTFRVSHEHVEHENLLPGFDSMVLMKNS
ncbi:hypothetical protein BASA81_008355 [Batrachochytrium salamandrivorans]|nr:hypothetical protein BASA81_008355 [Batrachochytrium salamandrivorans]